MSRDPRDCADKSLMYYVIETSQQYWMGVLTLFPFFFWQGNRNAHMDERQ